MRARLARIRLLALVVTASCAVCLVSDAYAQTRETVTIRGRSQSPTVRHARRGSVIVSSGDGGWITASHVAEVLAAKGYFVVGFDVKAYLESFTSGTTTLGTGDEPNDFEVLAEFAARATTSQPILIGVSEGAGLSVLAASDARMKAAIAGVIGLGLPDLNELGWRARDMLIYLTTAHQRASVQRRVHRRPRGTASARRDSFFTRRIRTRFPDSAADGARQGTEENWIVDAADHRFSDNLTVFDECLLEAITWITRQDVRK